MLLQVKTSWQSYVEATLEPSGCEISRGRADLQSAQLDALHGERLPEPRELTFVRFVHARAYTFSRCIDRWHALLSQRR